MCTARAGEGRPGSTLGDRHDSLLFCCAANDDGDGHRVAEQRNCPRREASVPAQSRGRHPDRRRAQRRDTGGPGTYDSRRGTPDDRLRAVGLSVQKISYLRDLSRRIQDGSLPLDRLHHMEDEAVIASLVEVKGIGRWTAEMFLMFRLQRPDVLPVGDLGIVKAVQKQYRMRKTPTPDRLKRIGETWRPYRSVACWYLWASLDNVPTSRAPDVR